MQAQQVTVALWPLLLTATLIFAVSGFLRKRMLKGRDPIGVIFDELALILGTAGGVLLIVWLIIGITMPDIERGVNANCAKSKANAALCGIYNGTLLAQKNDDPWASSAQQPAAVVPTTAPAVATGPEIPVFVSVKFADGVSRDVCAVRADSTGTYNIAVLCDENDKVSSNTLSLVGADLAPLAGKLPTAPTPIPTQAPAAAVASPLLFEQNEAAAQCFWVELLRRKSELKTFGAQLLPAGSTWVLEAQNSGFWNSKQNEVYMLCSVKWGYCFEIDGVAGEKLNHRSADPFYGEGSFPSQCVPTANP